MNSKKNIEIRLNLMFDSIAVNTFLENIILERERTVLYAMHIFFKERVRNKSHFLV